MNGNSRTPYHQLPIALVFRAIDRKYYRDIFCMECGHPFMAISDKFVSVQDTGINVQKMRDNNMIIEARCKNHACKQYYRLWI